MKLISSLTLLALAAPALAQTGSQTPAKPAVHHATTAAHRRAATACADAPTLGADIPKIAGCPKTLYALRYIDTVVGSGPLAEPMKLYSVHYTGYLLDGKKFDSSLDRKEPISFPVGLHRVITGWDTGFAGMHVGGKRRLFIPYQLAYGDAGRPPIIPAKSMLIFDLELLDQKDLPQQPNRAPGAPGGQPGQPGGLKLATPPPAGATPPAGQPKPATPPAGSTPPATATPPPAPGAIPTPPPASAPGTVPGSAPKPADPTKPTTVPPPTDPTKPATPPATTPTPSS